MANEMSFNIIPCRTNYKEKEINRTFFIIRNKFICKPKYKNKRELIINNWKQRVGWFVYTMY